VQALVPRNELIGEGQPRHQATLLQPEDGTEAEQERERGYVRAVMQYSQVVSGGLQQIVSYLPEKKMPSIAVYAISLSAKESALQEVREG
jgi:hypothetical protein